MILRVYGIESFSRNEKVLSEHSLDSERPNFCVRLASSRFQAKDVDDESREEHFSIRRTKNPKLAISAESGYGLSVIIVILHCVTQCDTMNVQLDAIRINGQVVIAGIIRAML